MAALVQEQCFFCLQDICPLSPDFLIDLLFPSSMAWFRSGSFWRGKRRQKQGEGDTTFVRALRCLFSGNNSKCESFLLSKLCPVRLRFSRSRLRLLCVAGAVDRMCSESLNIVVLVLEQILVCLLAWYRVGVILSKVDVTSI